MPDDINLFEIFHSEIQKICVVRLLSFLTALLPLSRSCWIPTDLSPPQAKPELPAEDVIAMLSALCNLALTCYFEKLEYVDKVPVAAAPPPAVGLLTMPVRGIDPEVCLHAPAKRRLGQVRHSASSGYRKSLHAPVPRSIDGSMAVNNELTQLLQLPVDKYADINTVLQLSEYAGVFDLFAFSTRHQMALNILKTLTARGDTLKSGDEVRYDDDMCSGGSRRWRTGCLMADWLPALHLIPCMHAG